VDTVNEGSNEFVWISFVFLNKGSVKDNVNVFLDACGTHFQLRDSQLFTQTDLSDLSVRAIADNEEELQFEQERRLRNVAITIYWLGKSIRNWYSGPQLDLSCFTELVGHCSNQAFQTSRPRSSVCSPVGASPLPSDWALPVTSSLPFGAVPTSEQPPAAEAHWSLEKADTLKEEEVGDNEGVYYVQDDKTGIVHKIHSRDTTPSEYNSVLSSCYSNVASPKLHPETDPAPGLCPKPDDKENPVMRLTADSSKTSSSRELSNMYESRRSSSSPFSQSHNASSDSSSTFDGRVGDHRDDEYNRFRFGEGSGDSVRTSSGSGSGSGSGSSSGYRPPTRNVERRSSAAPAYDPLKFISSKANNPLHEAAKKTIVTMQEQKKSKGNGRRGPIRAMAV